MSSRVIGNVEMLETSMAARLETKMVIMLTLMVSLSTTKIIECSFILGLLEGCNLETRMVEKFSTGVTEWLEI